MKKVIYTLFCILTLIEWVFAQGEVMKGVALVRLSPDALNKPYPQVLSAGSFGSADFQEYLSSIGFTEAKRYSTLSQRILLGQTFVEILCI